MANESEISLPYYAPHGFTSSRSVVRVGEHFLAKYGLQINLIEGENMLFIKQFTNIPVPEVYALYAVSPTRKKYIVMEYIEGHALSQCWDDLDLLAKTAVADQLRDIFATMRRLPSPGYFGSMGKRALRESMFWTQPGEVEQPELINGPFESEQDLNDALWRKYLHIGTMPDKAAYYRRVLPRVLCGHAPTFTHGDLQRKNVIRRTATGTVVLLDWESAGWYPSYWEYAIALFACGAWWNNWHEWVARILVVKYANEFAWIEMLARELWS